MGTPTKSDVIAMNPTYDLNEYGLPAIPKKPLIKVFIHIKQIFPKADPLLIDLINKIMKYSP